MEGMAFQLLFLIRMYKNGHRMLDTPTTSRCRTYFNLQHHLLQSTTCGG